MVVPMGKQEIDDDVPKFRAFSCALARSTNAAGAVFADGLKSWPMPHNRARPCSDKGRPSARSSAKSRSEIEASAKDEIRYLSSIARRRPRLRFCFAAVHMSPIGTKWTCARGCPPLGESAGEALVLSVSAYDPKPPYEGDAGQLT